MMSAKLSMIPLLVADRSVPATVRDALAHAMGGADRGALCDAAVGLLSNYQELSRAEVADLLGVQNPCCCSA